MKLMLLFLLVGSLLMMAHFDAPLRSRRSRRLVRQRPASRRTFRTLPN